MWWLANQILGKLNDDYDQAVLDRTLELHEALNALKRYHPEVKTEKETKLDDVIMEGYKEYLEQADAIIAEAEKMAKVYEEYEKWALEEQQYLK